MLGLFQQTLQLHVVLLNKSIFKRSAPPQVEIIWVEVSSSAGLEPQAHTGRALLQATLPPVNRDKNVDGYWTWKTCTSATPVYLQHRVALLQSPPDPLKHFYQLSWRGGDFEAEFLSSNRAQPKTRWLWSDSEPTVRDAFEVSRLKQHVNVMSDSKHEIQGISAHTEGPPGACRYNEYL